VTGRAGIGHDGGKSGGRRAAEVSEARAGLALYANPIGCAAANTTANKVGYLGKRPGRASLCLSSRHARISAGSIVSAMNCQITASIPS
jgi:hypothetical protein